MVIDVRTDTRYLYGKGKWDGFGLHSQPHISLERLFIDFKAVCIRLQYNHLWLRLRLLLTTRNDFMP